MSSPILRWEGESIFVLECQELENMLSRCHLSFAFDALTPVPRKRSNAALSCTKSW